jgi:hypothetical protein
MVVGRDRGDLGYDLGYLRHGSFGRASPDGPADRGELLDATARAWPASGSPALAARWRASCGLGAAVAYLLESATDLCAVDAVCPRRGDSDALDAVGARRLGRKIGGGLTSSFRL